MRILPTYKMRNGIAESFHILYIYALRKIAFIDSFRLTCVGTISLHHLYNDLECNLKNSVYKFADYTKILGKVQMGYKAEILQDD